jgi:CheY-like chemotaxis protein
MPAPQPPGPVPIVGLGWDIWTAGGLFRAPRRAHGRWRGFVSGPVLEDRAYVPSALQTLRVLVVDDEPLIRWSVSETLGAAGYLVSEAPDGATTKRSLALGPPPDVVLLDFRLPDSRDLTLLADVRRLAPSAAVVMMTACGDDDIADTAETLGAWRVIDKPVDMRELDGIVRTAAAEMTPFSRPAV